MPAKCLLCDLSLNTQTKVHLGQTPERGSVGVLIRSNPRKGCCSTRPPFPQFCVWAAIPESGRPWPEFADSRDYPKAFIALFPDPA